MSSQTHPEHWPNVCPQTQSSWRIKLNLLRSSKHWFWTTHKFWHVCFHSHSVQNILKLPLFCLSCTILPRMQLSSVPGKALSLRIWIVVEWLHLYPGFSGQGQGNHNLVIMEWSDSSWDHNLWNSVSGSLDRSWWHWNQWPRQARWGLQTWQTSVSLCKGQAYH